MAVAAGQAGPRLNDRLRQRRQAKEGTHFWRAGSLVCDVGSGVKLKKFYSRPSGRPGPSLSHIISCGRDTIHIQRINVQGKSSRRRLLQSRIW